MLAIYLFIGIAQLDQACRRHIVVFFGLVFFLDLVKRIFKVLVVHAHDHIAEHVDESPVGVVGESLVVGRRREARHRIVGQPEIENGVHHPRHGCRRPGANRNQQRVRLGTENLAGLLFEGGDIAPHLIHEPLGHLPAHFVVGGAHLGGDGESRGDGQADRTHVGQVRPLAPQQFAL